MRYREGDRIVIKTWKELEYDYGVNKDGSINIDPPFTPKQNLQLTIRTNDKRVLTIKNIIDDRYAVEENELFWTEQLIKGYACICQSQLNKSDQHMSYCPLYYEKFKRNLDIPVNRFSFMDFE